MGRDLSDDRQGEALDQPDVAPVSGDERETSPNPAPWLESDDEFEGVGAHRDNPRYDPVDET